MQKSMGGDVTLDSASFLAVVKNCAESVQDGNIGTYTGIKVLSKG